MNPLLLLLQLPNQRLDLLVHQSPHRLVWKNEYFVLNVEFQSNLARLKIRRVEENRAHIEHDYPDFEGLTQDVKYALRQTFL